MGGPGSNGSSAPAVRQRLLSQLREADIDRYLALLLMPADIQKTLSVQDLVDVVEYLTTLKQAKQ